MEVGVWQILEPLMNVEVITPAEYQSVVLAGLNKRKAIVIGQDMTSTYSTLLCEVCADKSQL